MSGFAPTAGLAAAVAAVTLAFVPQGGSAATQMFKCIVGNRTVYQQQGCPVTAETAPASGAAASAGAAKAASAPREVAATRRIRPASHPASAALATPR
jgi:hypothetical protein